MPNYWRNCPHNLLKVSSDNQLMVTDDFLRNYLSYPELALVEQSCDIEKGLHQRLLENPQALISDEEIAQMADEDIRVNYTVWLGFRTQLLNASSLEKFYMSLFTGDGVDIPPLFIRQLTQVFLKHILGENAHPLDLRVAELFFRDQRISVLEDGIIVAADQETVNQYAQTATGDTFDLLKQEDQTVKKTDLDVLHEDNAELYFTRDEDFNLVIQLNHGQYPSQHLCGVLEKWIDHFLGTEVKIQTLNEISDIGQSWHVGLDAHATEIFNTLYHHGQLDPNLLKQIICLFDLKFVNTTDALQAVSSCPIYLGIAMSADGQLKLKPQNVLFNLPLAQAS